MGSGTRSWPRQQRAGRRSPPGDQQRLVDQDAVGGVVLSLRHPHQLPPAQRRVSGHSRVASSCPPSHESPVFRPGGRGLSRMSMSGLEVISLCRSHGPAACCALRVGPFRKADEIVLAGLTQCPERRSLPAPGTIPAGPRRWPSPRRPGWWRPAGRGWRRAGATIAVSSTEVASGKSGSGQADRREPQALSRLAVRLVLLEGERQVPAQTRGGDPGGEVGRRRTDDGPGDVACQAERRLAMMTRYTG